MNFRNLAVSMAFLATFSLRAEAMLVAYQDSFGIMGYNQSFHNELFLNYSLTSHFAVGERTIKFLTIDGTKEFFIPEADFLVARFNEKDSQANLYAGAGYGAQSFMGQTSGVGMVNLAADWESRKYYLDAEFQSLAGSDSKFYTSDPGPKNWNSCNLSLFASS
jgi:hypothetical protein